MAVAFTQISWWLSTGKHKEPLISNGSSINSLNDNNLWDSDNVKFPLSRSNAVSSSRNIKRKWKSREERKIDREYDIVLVPPDAGCISGSESDDSDWSIGWLEPHGPGFQSDDDPDDSFAVLVRCYGCVQEDVLNDPNRKILHTVGNVADIYHADIKEYVEQCLSFLQEELN